MKKIWKLTYKNERNAINVALRSTLHHNKPLRVVLGDEGEYWVTTPRIAEFLASVGYEVLI